MPPEFQVNRYFQSFLQRVGPGLFSRGKHRRCVSRHLCKLRSRLAPLSVLNPIVWAVPARRAAFKPPRFEVNRLFQSFCSAAHPVDFSFEKPLGADLDKAPMKHRKPAGFPSPFRPDRLGRPGEEGRLLNHPGLKSIDKSQRCAVRFGWPENRRKIHCPAHRFEAPALP